MTKQGRPIGTKNTRRPRLYGLLRVRTAKNVSRAAIAARLYCTEQAVARWESHKKRTAPPDGTAEILAEMLGCEIGELYRR